MITNQNNEITRIDYWLIIVTSIASVVLSPIAMAYVGPGAGLTLIGSLIGVVVAILIAVGVVLFWPLRLLIRRLRGKLAQNATTPNDNAQPVNPGNSNDS
jgi:uncharacterized membrane protein YhaH (DUF805 family)